MRIKLELDIETTEMLIKSAVENKRPIPLQAEWLLLQALKQENNTKR